MSVLIESQSHGGPASTNTTVINPQMTTSSSSSTTSSPIHRMNGPDHPLHHAPTNHQQNGHSNSNHHSSIQPAEYESREREEDSTPAATHLFRAPSESNLPLDNIAEERSATNSITRSSHSNSICDQPPRSSISGNGPAAAAAVGTNETKSFSMPMNDDIVLLPSAASLTCQSAPPIILTTEVLNNHSSEPDASLPSQHSLPYTPSHSQAHSLQSPAFDSTSTTVSDSSSGLSTTQSMSSFQLEPSASASNLMTIPPMLKLMNHLQQNHGPHSAAPPPPSLVSEQSFSSTNSDESTFRNGNNSHSSSLSDPPLNSSIPPPANSTTGSISSAFTFWIGSWNMGAKECSAQPVPPPTHGTNGSNPSHLISPFEAWIPSGYKLYVIGLQESISENFYKSLDIFFNSRDCYRMQIPATSSTTGEFLSGTLGGTVKIEGRGDGSFLYPKCTSIAMWIERSARGLVSYAASGALSLGITQGSKGGAAIGIKIYDTTLVFVSCHLSSTTLNSRRSSYTSLIESVGNSLGDKYFQLLEQFHHTFFLGDLNFRLKEGLGAAEAVQFMQRKDVNGLLMYDELSTEMRLGGAFHSFREAPIDFFPTYKKHEGRTQPTPSKSNIYWVHDVYKTIYKQPWYKSGNTAQRVPSWCDRIIRHSVQDQADRLTVLKYHPNEPQIDASDCSPTTRSQSRIGGVGSLSTYRALEDGLSTSDHTAVSCGFQLQLPIVIDWSKKSQSASISSTHPPTHLTSNTSHTHSTIPGAITPLTVSSKPLTTIPPTRLSSSSVSSPNQRSLQTTTPTVYIVRLLSVRVIQSPSVSHPISPIVHSLPLNLFQQTPQQIIDLGMEPKYARILFPGPFESGVGTPFSSRQVNFSPQHQNSIVASPHQQLQRLTQAVNQSVQQSQQTPTGDHLDLPTRSASTSTSTTTSPSTSQPASPALRPHDSPTPTGGHGSLYKAEFRCIAFEDANHLPMTAANGDSSRNSSFSSNAGLTPTPDPDLNPPVTTTPLPLPAPYHFLLKVHTTDDLSGQCCVALPRHSFELKQVLEFHQHLTRDGLPLIHTYTKQEMQVHFIVALDMHKPNLLHQPQPVPLVGRASSTKNM